MTAQINSREAARRYQQEAQVLWEEMDRWLEEHPQATLKEIEQHIRPLRRRLMAKMVELQLLKRGNRLSVIPVTRNEWKFILSLEKQ